MKSIVNILEDFEKLVYKILIWVILIPKTIVKIILNPGFAPGYVHDELEHDKESPFDEYMSPMLLYLGVTLVPALAIYFLPVFSLSVTKPEEVSVLSRQIDFEVEATFKSNPNVLYHQFGWSVWQVCGPLSEGGGIVCEGEGYTPRFISGQAYNEYEGLAAVNQSDEIVGGWDPAADTRIFFTDSNTVINSFPYEFALPGVYRVETYAFNFQLERPGEIVEYYPASIEVYVPVNTEEPMQVYTYEGYASESGLGVDLAVPGKVSGQDGPSLGERLQSGETIFLGLALLLPPLLFAVASKMFQASEKKGVISLQISESELKEGFYTQCYYFVPVGLTFWAAYYSDFFYTSDLHFERRWLLIPFVIVCIWFIGVEVSAIANLSERATTRKWIAPGLVMVCLGVMAAATYMYFTFGDDTDLLRKSSIWAYPGTVILMILTALVLRIRRWRRSRRESQAQPQTPPA